MISGKFIKSSFLITLGNALPLLSGIVLLPFYINILSTEHFAELAIYISITFLLQLFFGFGLETYMSIIHIKFKGEPSVLQKGIGSLFTITIVIGLILSLTALVTGNSVFNLIFNNNFHFFPFGYLSVLTAFFNQFFKLHNNLLLAQQEVRKFFMANVINFFATLLISLIGLFIYQDSLWGPILGRFLSGLIIFVLSFIGFKKHYPFSWQVPFLKDALSFSVPMFIFFIFNWAMNYYDRIIIENNMPLADLAVYDFATKCTLPLEFLQNGLFAAITPLIYKIWSEQNLKKSTPEVNRYFNGYTAVFLILIPLSCLVIPLLVPLVIYKEAYFESFKYIGLIAVGYSFKAYYFIYYVVVLYYHKTKVLPYVYLILASLQIGLMLISTQYFGLMGIIISTLLIKMVQPIVMYFFTRTDFEFSFNKLKIIYLPLIFTGVVLFTYHYTNTVSLYWIYGFQLLFVVTAIYLIYKNELLFVANKFLKKKS